MHRSKSESESIDECTYLSKSRKRSWLKDMMSAIVCRQYICSILQPLVNLLARTLIEMSMYLVIICMKTCQNNYFTLSLVLTCMSSSSSREANTTIWSCYANLNRYHYSCPCFYSLYYKYRKMCIAPNCRADFATVVIFSDTLFRAGN